MARLPGHQHKIDERNKILEWWVRRKRGNRKLECSGCGRKLHEVYDCKERAVRDLPGKKQKFLTVVCNQRWIDQLRWQRLGPFQELALMLLDHPDGILNYCRTKVSPGVVEAVNGKIKSLLRRGRGYKNPRHLLLKAQRMAAARTEFVVFKKAA
jgi:transposase